MASSLIDLRAIPCPREGVDVMTMPLTSMEGFLFSRIDGILTVEELCATVSLGHEEVSEMLNKLSDLGAVDILEISEEVSEPPPELPPEQPKEAPEEVDLSEEMKQQISAMRLRVEQVNFYEMLGVAPTADRSAIRKAYFGLSKTFHPDSHFKKNLGRYRAMMELIFARITEAYETLSRRKRRARYDEYITDQINAWEMEMSLTGEASQPPPEAPSGTETQQGAGSLEVYAFAAKSAEQAQPGPGPFTSDPSSPEMAPEPGLELRDPIELQKFSSKPKSIHDMVAQGTTSPNTAPSSAPPISQPPISQPPISQPISRAPSSRPPLSRPPMSRPISTVPPPSSPPPASSDNADISIGTESALHRKMRQRKGRQAIQALLKGVKRNAPPPPPVKPGPKISLGIEFEEPDFMMGSVQDKLSYQYAQAGLEALQIGDLSAAVNAFEVGVSLAPNDEKMVQALDQVRSKAQGALSSTYVRQGRYEEEAGKFAQASASFLKALQFKSDDDELMNRAAVNLLRGDGDLKKARGLARRAVGLQPKSSEYRLTLGEIYLKMGSEQDAIKELEEAQQLDPKNRRVTRLLRGIGR